jgi:hypothetical protein
VPAAGVDQVHAVPFAVVLRQHRDQQPGAQHPARDEAGVFQHPAADRDNDAVGDQIRARIAKHEGKRQAAATEVS